MSWLEPHDKKNDEEKEKESMSQRFFTACLLILAGVIALSIAVEFLAQIWGWLVLLGVIVAGIWIAVRVVKARRDRW